MQEINKLYCTSNILFGEIIATKQKTVLYNTNQGFGKEYQSFHDNKVYYEEDIKIYESLISFAKDKHLELIITNQNYHLKNKITKEDIQKVMKIAKFKKHNYKLYLYYKEIAVVISNHIKQILEINKQNGEVILTASKEKVFQEILSEYLTLNILINENIEIDMKYIGINMALSKVKLNTARLNGDFKVSLQKNNNNLNIDYNNKKDHKVKTYTLKNNY